MSSYLGFAQKLELSQDSHDLLMFKNTKNVFKL
jgi:hypothetical protein